jgi:Ca2+-binding EF-hand superfamily protein
MVAIGLLAALLLPTEAPGEAPLTLLVLTPTSPAFFKIEIETSGTDLEAAWEENARRLFDRLDEDDDGFLGESERIPDLLGPEETASPASASFGTLFPGAMIGGADWLAFRDRLRASAPPFQLRSTPRQTSGDNDPLFDRLDRDGDGSLTGEELADAFETLSRADFDEDELIRLAELAPGQGLVQGRFLLVEERLERAGGEPDLILPLPGDLPSRTEAIRALLHRYDDGRGEPDGPRKDGRLNATELGIAPEALTPFDLDDDGRLDSRELWEYLEAPPIALQARITLGEQVSSIEDLGEDLGNTPGSRPVTGRSASDQFLRIDLGKMEFEFVADPSRSDGEAIGRDVDRLLESLDSDANGYIDAPESERSVAFRGESFGRFDLDSDGKLFREEILRVAQLRAEVARGQVVLSVSELSPSLTRSLDRDQDGAFGRRELRGGPALVAAWDRDGDGAIRPEEIPVNYRAVLAPGTPELPGFPVQVRARLAVDADPAGVPHEAGPLWFRKMDRNRDGDLSPGEFLGTSDDFSNLDQDDDGLVDALEARQAAPPDGG